MKIDFGMRKYGEIIDFSINTLIFSSIYLSKPASLPVSHAGDSGKYARIEIICGFTTTAREKYDLV